ncbi:hypothetical protein R3W88_015142 [Solanum pinnatisectum]|uniref:Flavin-containing monooxygenase n=1 Tax=Solanum pinnatisectum TaxID=50273 RepID=A0AAV9KU05_9SOLN|nr:hypothetical protein R3W88_015142 [Solanum pinnatisectum]
MAESRRVAVIGAGPSGLVTARELQREGHRVVVFEKSNQLGGLWVYNPRVETDLLSLDLNREIIHSSLYKSLRTNLPRQLMSLSDYYFDCIKNWPGKQLHSHNYRVPEPFKDQIVVVIGDGPSGLDICRDIATVAKQVHLSTRSSEIVVSKLDNYENLWNHSKVLVKVTFLDGSSIHADIILHCTGYKYDFPFLETNGIVTVDDEGCAVGPLYKHVFPPKLSLCLSFVGIPSQVIIFLGSELQAKWIAQVLSGKVLLPSEDDMLADVEDHSRQLEEAGIPNRHTHCLHPHVIEYIDWLAARVEMPPIDAGRTEMYWSIYKFVGQVGWSGYRDLWNV